MAILAIAVVVPVLWMLCVGGGRWGQRDTGFAVRLALLSAVFWGIATRWLMANGRAGDLRQAAMLGVASPILALALAVPLGCLLLPFELVADGPGGMLTIAWGGVLVLLRIPHLVFPVGISMGFVVGVLLRRAVASPAPAAA